MATTEHKRPFYLVLALLGALALGIHGASGGWALMTLYRESIDPTAAGQGITDESDRALAVSRFDAFLVVHDRERSIAWPKGVAGMVVGVAVTLFAMRALGRRRGARALLVQLVVAQAGLDVASHWLLRDVEQAEVAAGLAIDVGHARDAFPDPLRAEQSAGALARLVIPAFVGLRILGCAFVVIALTRRRSRDFFDALAAAVEER